MADAIRTSRKRLSPLREPENVDDLRGYIRGTLIAIDGLRKQRNSGIRPELILMHRTRLDGLLDTLHDCLRFLPDGES